MPYFILAAPDMVLDGRLNYRYLLLLSRSSGFRIGLLTALPILSDSGLCGVRLGYSGGPAPDLHRLPSLRLKCRRSMSIHAEDSGWNCRIRFNRGASSRVLLCVLPCAALIGYGRCEGRLVARRILR